MISKDKITKAVYLGSFKQGIKVNTYLSKVN